MNINGLFLHSIYKNVLLCPLVKYLFSGVVLGAVYITGLKS